MWPRIGFFLALVVVVCFSHSALACSCAEPTPTRCKGIKSGVVFLGTVLSVDNPPGDQQNIDEGGVARYHFRVDEQFSGVEGNEIDVYSTRGGADCSFHFKKGEQYVVFPSRDKDDGRLFAYSCGNTRPASQAQALLPQLRAMRDGKKVASVYGVLQRSQQPYGSTWQDDFEEPIPHTEVRLVSGRRVWKTQTDTNGLYAFFDVPEGKYKFESSLPTHLELAQTILDGPLPPINLSENACFETDLDALPTATIKGRVLTEEGEPLDGVSVDLFLADHYKEGGSGWFEYQGHDRQMFFQFNHVAPGDYLLVFNDSNGLDTDAPYARTFYPGVPDLEHAKQIHVEEGQQVVNAYISVSGGKTSRKVKVRITGSKEQIANAWISVKGTMGDPPHTWRVAEGTYQLSLLREADYELFAEYSCHSSYEEYHKGNYKTWMVETPHIKVNGNDDAVSEIALPFSGGCR